MIEITNELWEVPLETPGSSQPNDFLSFINFMNGAVSERKVVLI